MERERKDYRTIEDLKKNLSVEAAQKAAFDRCIDYMTRLILKYGPGILHRMEEDKRKAADKSSGI